MSEIFVKKEGEEGKKEEKVVRPKVRK